MQVLVAVLIVLALTFMPAPQVTDTGTKGSITVHVSNEGAKIGIGIETTGNPRVVTEKEIYIK